MKYFLLLALTFCFCSGRIDNTKIEDFGKVQIGTNLYLKKIKLGGGFSTDRVYILVNGNDEVIAGTTTVYRVGKYEYESTVR
jgi:hypothetical protein